MRRAAKRALGILRLAGREPDGVFVEPGLVDSLPPFELIELLFDVGRDAGRSKDERLALHVARLADPAFLRASLVIFDVGAERRRARRSRTTEFPDQENAAVLIIVFLAQGVRQPGIERQFAVV